MLATYMEKNWTTELVPGEKSLYLIPNASAQGMHLLQTLTQHVHGAKDPKDPDAKGRNLEDEEDVEQEVDNDGGQVCKQILIWWWVCRDEYELELLCSM